MSKRSIVLLTLFVLLAVASLLLVKKCERDAFASESLINFLPTNSAIAVFIDRPVSTWQELRTHAIWQRLMKNEYIKDLNSGINRLDTLLHKNKRLFEVLGNRKLLWSWQKAGPDYKYLTAIDLKPSENNRATLQLFTSSYGLGLRRRDSEFEGLMIREFFEAEGSLFVCLADRALLMSESMGAMKSSILESRRKTRNIEEILLSSLDNGLMKTLVFNPELSIYIQDYFGDTELFKSKEWKAISAAGWSLNLDNSIQAKGRVLFDNSIESRLSIFTENDAFSDEVEQKANASLVASIYFENLLQIFERLLASGDEKDEMELEELISNIERFENYLDFKLEDDLIKYLANSLHYVRFQGESNYEHQVLIARLDNARKVEDNLEKLVQKIKLRTPLLPKKIELDQYSIQYFAFNKLFQGLFKELTGKVEFPFYTIVGDQLILSDKVRAIQEYVMNENIKTTVANKLLEENRSNLEVNILLKSYLKSMKRKDDKNGVFGEGAWALYSFPEFAMEVVRENDSSYGSNFYLTFEEDYNYRQYLEDRTKILIKAPKNNIVPEIVKATNWLPEDPNKKYEKERYENGKLKYLVKIKKGNYHGLYRAFYQNGKVKVKGFYRDGKRFGTWKYYDEEGKLFRKERVY